jgi:hypothetical protein
MHPYRLRILLADEPGRLGRAATALSEIGINILDVDVQGADGQLWADDLLIDASVPLDTPTIDHALRMVGIRLVDLQPAEPHDVVDCAVRCLDVVRGLAEGGTSDPAVTAAARRIVRAELTWLTPIPLLALRGVTAHAMISGAALQSREQVKLLPAAAGAWALAVPFEFDGQRRVLTLLRRAPRFSFIETARLEALLRIVTALEAGDPARDRLVVSAGSPTRK